jgi:hypothetical protein
MRPTRSELGALGVALAPFVVYVGSSFSETVNGRVVSAYDYNYAGIAFGIAAIVMAVRAFIRLPAEAASSEPHAVHAVAIAGIVALACYQIARGASLLT